MSKCKPTEGIGLANLASKGVTMTDAVNNGVRYVNIHVPYEALRDDKQVQAAFQDLVSLKTEELAI